MFKVSVLYDGHCTGIIYINMLVDNCRTCNKWLYCQSNRTTLHFYHVPITNSRILMSNVLGLHPVA
jgi:hypothetical protein